MWVDPMLLAMNWGAALLMALGLGIVYWHATRDTGAPSLWPLALALCTGMQPETQVSSPHQCKPCGLRTSWLVCVSQCMCGARSVRMCGANLQAFSSVLKSVLQMQSLYRELLRAVRT